MGHDGQHQLQEGRAAVRELPAARRPAVRRRSSRSRAGRAGAAAVDRAVPRCPGHGRGRGQRRDQAAAAEPRRPRGDRHPGRRQRGPVPAADGLAARTPAAAFVGADGAGADGRRHARGRQRRRRDAVRRPDVEGHGGSTRSRCSSPPRCRRRPTRPRAAADGSLLDYVAGPGQVPGDEIGQLPGGHAPLPDDLLACDRPRGRGRGGSRRRADGRAHRASRPDRRGRPTATPIAPDPLPVPRADRARSTLPAPTPVTEPSTAPPSPSRPSSRRRRPRPRRRTTGEAAPPMVMVAVAADRPAVLALPVLLVLALLALLAGPLLLVARPQWTGAAMAATLTRDVLRREAPAPPPAALRAAATGSRHRGAGARTEPSSDRSRSAVAGRRDHGPARRAGAAPSSATWCCGSALQADRSQDVMYEELRADLAAMTVPFAGAIAPGTPLGVLSIPSIGLEQVFVEGSTSEQTRTDPVSSATACSRVRPASPCWSGTGRRGRRVRATSTELRPGRHHRRDHRPGHGSATSSTWCGPATPRRPRSQVVPSRLTLVTSDPAFTPNRNLVVSARAARRRPAGDDRRRRPRPPTSRAGQLRPGWSRSCSGPSCSCSPRSP